MALRRAIGAVKDQTSIGLAKVGSSNSLADLDVAIVKATRHEEYPAEERHIREILSLTCYSRAYIGACVNTISRRLSKTKNWVVALKTLMLIHRLLIDGDPAYEQEIFFATRRGTRLLNLSDFRDTSRSNSWDYSAFVRTYALYLDERLEFRMQGKRKKHSVCAYSYEETDEDVQDNASNDSSKNTPLRDQKTEQLMSKVHHLQQLLERFLATKPTGVARFNRIIIIALYGVMKESFLLYYEITDILSVLIDRFVDLEIQYCVKVHDIFCRISKQFDELDAYYSWGKEIGIARTSEYPEVEKITPKKLELMDEFIRDKAGNRQQKLLTNEEEKTDNNDQEEQETPEEDMNTIKALPAPETKEEENDKEIVPSEEQEEPKEVDLLHLGDDAPTSEEQGDKLALALFDGELATTTSNQHPQTPMWEAFNDSSDWETALVQSASYLPHQKTNLGGGFDTMLLNEMYQQGVVNATLAANNVGGSGSASSVALGSIGNPRLLALPAPPPSSSSSSSSSGNVASTVNVDPFAPSLAVAPPPYVQMSDLEKKQRLLVEEQMLWQQYQRDGMQGQAALSKIQGQPHNVRGGYGYRY